MATPEDDIVSVLKAEGLDIEYWLPEFKGERITSKEALQHVKGDIIFLENWKRKLNLSGKKEHFVKYCTLWMNLK